MWIVSLSFLDVTYILQQSKPKVEEKKSELGQKKQTEIKTRFVGKQCALKLELRHKRGAPI